MKNKLDKIVINQSNGSSKHYISLEDFKREINKRDNKIKDLELKLENKNTKEYEIGNEVKWCNLDWYVIGLDDKNKLVKLMLKNVIKEIKYSDNNSNDWNYSNARAYLNNEFINKLDEDKLQLMNINYDERSIAHDYVAIPTLREIERLPMSIRNCGKSYWTMTASYGVSEDCSSAHVFYVNSNGYLSDDHVHYTHGLRPVITLRTETLY